MARGFVLPEWNVPLTIKSEIDDEEKDRFYDFVTLHFHHIYALILKIRAVSGFPEYLTWETGINKLQKSEEEVVQLYPYLFRRR